MSDDLIKRLWECGGRYPTQAADRIEQLERARKDLEKLSIKLLNEKLQGEWREPLENDLAETEAKLQKAVEALREIEADCDADYPPSHRAIKYAIRTVLAELEGK